MFIPKAIPLMRFKPIWTHLKSLRLCKLPHVLTEASKRSSVFFTSHHHSVLHGVPRWPFFVKSHWRSESLRELWWLQSNDVMRHHICISYLSVARGGIQHLSPTDFLPTKPVYFRHQDFIQWHLGCCVVGLSV